MGIGALAVGLVAGCGGSGDTEDAAAAAEAAEAAELARKAEAEGAFTLATFDTITWKADSVALTRGAVVWLYSCQKCHGQYGRGDGGFVQRGDTLHPPDFLEPGWALGEDHPGLLRKIFTGAPGGMPHWGLETRFKPRDIDAVAWYIQEVLRRDVDPVPGT
jgi:mono/diheme cytochrome c family protein